MKKLLAILLAATLCLGAFALAEEADGIHVNTLIEDGEFIIQIPAEDGGLGWKAFDMEQDPSVVTLAFEDVVEDTYVARYSPVGDGDMTVGVRHYFSSAACDQMMTWDLRVADGAVQEVIGGSQTMSPADEEIDPYVVGEWAEQETQFTRMTIEKNLERGWDLVIVSPVSHGAFVFKTGVLFDCERNGLVYDKGKLWDIDGEYDESAELGEAKVAGSTGVFSFEGDEENPILSWYDDERAVEDMIRFTRLEPAA